jgi:DNA-directed RNA polymerase alpha subunit
MRIRWRGLELPSRLIPDVDTATSTYCRFVAEPFERGFGVTVGNSLRRILLSSLEGSAVTRIKIQGVQHEISTIPGVVEDVTDIVLNLKGVRIRKAAEFKPALAAAIKDGKPCVIDVAMRNNPTPTAGHWNILDIYSPGKKVSHVATD